MSSNVPQSADLNRSPPIVLSSLPPKPDVTGSPSSGDGQTKPRRRRRGAGTETQPKNQSFYFVDSTSSSKEKRAHVMRHHVQEKRKHRKLSQGSLQPEHAAEPPTTRVLEMDSGHGTQGPRSASSAPETTNPFDQPSLVQPPKANSFVHETGSSRAGSSGTLHDSSWGGHFSTPLIIQNREDIELTDWWINKLAYWSGQNPYVKTQIYRTAMDHPFSFQAVILVYAARWRAQITGQSNSEEVQRHVGQVRKNLEDAVSGVIQVHDDQLATALAGMALAEGRYGSRQDAEAYLEHAARILRRRPGASTGVEVFFHYVRYILPPLTDMVSPTNRRWLVLFLQRAQELMQRHSSPEHQPQSSHRRTAFQMGSPLFSLLSSGPRPTQVPQEAHVYVVRTAETQEASRSGCLIYITTALWDFKDSVNKTHRFLAYLTALVEEHQLGRHPACETLLWLLLEQTCDADLRDPERAWSTGQLLQAQRQLRPDLQFHYNELLMSFLSLQMPVRGIDIFQNELESSFGERRHSPYS